MNVFYYLYSYRYVNHREQQSLAAVEDVLNPTPDLAPLMGALKELELDVDAEVLERVMAYAREA